jgi:amino acid transporter
VLAGCGCALAALCYAEFAAMVPVSGSAYSYAYAAFGEVVAWFIGWNLVLEYTFSVATVSVGWSGYVMSLLAQFGVHLPEVLTQAPYDRGPGSFSIVRTGALVNVPAVLVVAAVAAICYVGIRQSSTTNTIIVAVKIGVVAAFVLMGMSHDGLLPRWFARVHPRFKTPANGTWLTGLAAAVIGGLFPVRILGELVSIGTLLAFITVCLGVLVLRKTRPELPRPFRVPWPWVTCVGGAATLERIWSNVKQVMAAGALDPLTKELVYVAVSATNN